MYALVDCNNFFVSCERAFNPALNNKPVVVLSNNDGCVISRSNEAKQLGIKMCVPAFKIKDLIARHGVRVFSSNYVLYGDMSGRVMNILAALSPDLEVYSIDEAFLHLSNESDFKRVGEHIARTVFRGTGIPVSLGIAPTKTLAKVANKFAKKYTQYRRVCVIDTEEKRLKALQLTSIEEVWGIGRRLSARLMLMGIKTAYDFTLMEQKQIRQMMTVTGERLWRELKGEPCIDLEKHIPDKQQICTSRSFGEMLTTLPALSEAVATHASSCARKLRQQKSCAVSLLVFVHTNKHRRDLLQYQGCDQMTLPFPTSDTIEIVQSALFLLRKIFVPGFCYKKAGVIITQIVPEQSIQHNLFDQTDRSKSQRLMQTIDHINRFYNQTAIKLAVQGTGQCWRLKSERLSRRFSTSLGESILVKV